MPHDAGHANELSVTTAFEDTSRAEHMVTVVAPAYTGPAAVYETPQVDTPRALALRLTGGKTPIGQHSLSIASNGDLLLFNNGFASLEQPPGTSPGLTRSFSAPSRYTIDETARTAAEVWTYVTEPPVYSDICSSTYETTPGNYLVAYAAAAGRTRGRLLSVNSAGQLAFDYEFPSMSCSTVFIVQPIAFGNLVLK